MLIGLACHLQEFRVPGGPAWISSERFDVEGKSDDPAAGEVPSGRDGNQLPLADPAGPSLFIAIQEQLGLRLESTCAPVEILVIDHVERPSLN